MLAQHTSSMQAAKRLLAKCDAAPAVVLLQLKKNVNNNKNTNTTNKKRQLHELIRSLKDWNRPVHILIPFEQHPSTPSIIQVISVTLKWNLKWNLLLSFLTELFFSVGGRNVHLPSCLVFCGFFSVFTPANSWLFKRHASDTFSCSNKLWTKEFSFLSPTPFATVFIRSSVGTLCKFLWWFVVVCLLAFFVFLNPSVLGVQLHHCWCVRFTIMSCRGSRKTAAWACLRLSRTVTLKHTTAAYKCLGGEPRTMHFFEECFQLEKRAVCTKY